MKTMGMSIVFLAVLMSGGATYAQMMDLGIKAGVNFGSLHSSSDAVRNVSGKRGLHVGFFARTGGDFYVQPEVNFSTLRATYSYGETPYAPTFRQLDVPLMAGYKIINNGSMNLRVSAGPAVALNLNSPLAPARTAYKRANVGGVLNAGVDVGRLTFDARYGFGLTTMHDRLEQKPRTFSLSLGFNIL
ncbi:Outer membrane protein beta-barrel domain-containing protein [Parapedobacter koreensis]|uniref:Outer membrane protein beta-barrel domain-containing protein n=2 Tax=Parapedobacter koreensis TaxID=332977 RepID=A0A1H7SRA2_9SPHI|nr:Outer membrane protein beta-barrel domain-containing protein [Parapedobacter koreensis]